MLDAFDALDVRAIFDEVDAFDALGVFDVVGVS